MQNCWEGLQSENTSKKQERHQGLTGELGRDTDKYTEGKGQWDRLSSDRPAGVQYAAGQTISSIEAPPCELYLCLLVLVSASHTTARLAAATWDASRGGEANSTGVCPKRPSVSDGVSNNVWQPYKQRRVSIRAVAVIKGSRATTSLKSSELMQKDWDVTRAFDKRAWLYVLPLLEFAGGHVSFIQQLPRQYSSSVSCLVFAQIWITMLCKAALCSCCEASFPSGSHCLKKQQVWHGYKQSLQDLRGSGM